MIFGAYRKDAQNSTERLQDPKTVFQPDFGCGQMVLWIARVVEQEIELAFEFVDVDNNSIIRQVLDDCQLLRVVFDTGKEQSEYPG